MAQALVKRGSVVLVRYPFTDLTGAKVRPALVLTPDHLLPRLEDVLCLFISSAMPEELLSTDFVLDLVDRQYVDRLAQRAGRMEHRRGDLLAFVSLRRSVQWLADEVTPLCQTT